ncbi:MAG: trypsin-like peptidase domain-containing protein [Verrucomicrobia bacterium]|nr:trypsin-like peptidase domain-containing protein [Verrucomicrobiota bacterium]
MGRTGPYRRTTLHLLGTALAWISLGCFIPKARAQTTPEIVSQAKQAMIEVDALDAQGNLLKTGSAFFVDGHGLAVTNQHVVQGAARVVGVSGTGEHYSCERVFYAPSGLDLAVLKFVAVQKPYLVLGSSQSAIEGERVWIIGNPGGLPGTDSAGEISAFLNHGQLIQITGPLWPGSSGSPVLDQSGKVIGVAVGPQLDGQTLNFAIPAEFVSAALSAARTPSNGGAHAVAAAPPGSTRPAPAPAPASAPPSTPVPDPKVAEDRVGRFLQEFMRSWNSGTGLSDVDFYADRARYDGKKVPRSVIAREEAAYNARWPKRRFWLISSPTVETVGDSVQRVRLRAGFAVGDGKRYVTGEASYQIDLEAAGDTFQVVGLDEQITKRDASPRGSSR